MKRRLPQSYQTSTTINKLRTYNFCESVEGPAVLARQDFDLGVRSGDGVLAQYYYVRAAPLGVLVDDVELVEQVLHVGVDVEVDGGAGLLGLLLGRSLALLDAGDAVEGKRNGSDDYTNESKR